MAKMAELHALLSEPSQHCEYCSDPIEICKELEECPGAYKNRLEIEGGCFFCDSRKSCICDEVTDAYRERDLL
jgi:hypothetical protein